MSQPTSRLPEDGMHPYVRQPGHPFVDLVQWNGLESAEIPYARFLQQSLVCLEPGREVLVFILESR